MIGTDSFSAFWKSLSIVLLNSCVALANPNSATVNEGLDFCRPATASSSGCTRLSAVSIFPFMSNSISCARRSFETSPAAPVRRFVTCGIVRSFASTPCTDARNVGSATVRVRERTSTASDAGVLKPALARICSARAVSPVDCSDTDSLCVPSAVPTPIATATKATHTATAVFQCAALHRPARAARLRVSITPTPFNPSKT